MDYKFIGWNTTDGADKVWVPERFNKRSSGIGLHTWYVRALIKEHFGVEE